jgi:hypothetical protein
MNLKYNIHAKYVFGWAVRIIVVLFSMVVAKLLNGIGHDSYASFLIIMALINSAPIFERGMGFYAQNRISIIKSKKLADGVLLKIFINWIYTSVPYFLLIFIIILIFRDYLGLINSLQNVNIMGFGSGVIVASGFFCSFLLAAYSVIQKGMLGLGRDYTALTMQAIPYVVSALAVFSLVVFFDDLLGWVVPFYFLFFSVTLILGVLVFFVRFSKRKSKVSTDHERVKNSKFSNYTLLGVFILTSETIFAGVYLDSTNLANYGILQRVYLSIIMLTAVVNQINWSKYTSAYLNSSNLDMINLSKSLLLQSLAVFLFLILVLSYRNYWMDFFHVKSDLALEIHIFFSISILTRIILEGIATFYLATNRILLMLVAVFFQFIFVISSILYLNDDLDLFYLSLIQMCSFILSIIFVVILSKTRISEIYG